MSEKKVKIILDDEVIEYTLEENKSLLLEVQNVSNQLRVNKKEKLDRLSNNFEQIQFNQPSHDSENVTYKPKQRGSSIYEVLNNKNDIENAINDVSQNDNKKETHTGEENNTQEEHSQTLSESLKEIQENKSNDDEPNEAYKDMVSELYKELADDTKKTNA